MNPGGIRADIAGPPAGTAEEPVTFGDLFAVQPFDNQVVKFELTGDQIRRVLEQQFPPTQARETFLQVSGLKYAYDSTRPEGERITSLTTTGGAPIVPTQRYTVAANSFLVPGGGDRFTVFKEAQNTTTVGGDLEALEDYIDGLDQPFTAPNPATEQRITKQG